MGRHSLSTHWAKHELGFKFNLGRRTKVVMGVDYSVKDNRTIAKDDIVTDVLKDQSEIERRWDEALSHNRGCRCGFCWARRTVKNPPAGIDYEFLDIEGIRYSVVGDQIDLTKHHDSCGCVECMNARGTRLFKHTPAPRILPGHEPRYPMVDTPIVAFEDDIAAEWNEANI